MRWRVKWTKCFSIDDTTIKIEWKTHVTNRKTAEGQFNREMKTLESLVFWLCRCRWSLKWQEQRKKKQTNHLKHFNCVSIWFAHIHDAKVFSILILIESIKSSWPLIRVRHQRKKNKIDRWNEPFESFQSDFFFASSPSLDVNCSIISRITWNCIRIYNATIS